MEVDAALARDCYQKLQEQSPRLDRQMLRVLVMTLASFTIVGIEPCGFGWLVRAGAGSRRSDRRTKFRLPFAGPPDVRLFLDPRHGTDGVRFVELARGRKTVWPLPMPQNQ